MSGQDNTIELNDICRLLDEAEVMQDRYNAARLYLHEQQPVARDRQDLEYCYKVIDRALALLAGEADDDISQG